MTLCQSWITEQDLADCALCNIGGLAQNQAEQIIETASQILYLLTGQQFPGQCVDQVRPCGWHEKRVAPPRTVPVRLAERLQHLWRVLRRRRLSDPLAETAGYFGANRTGRRRI